MPHSGVHGNMSTSPHTNRKTSIKGLSLQKIPLTHGVSFLSHREEAVKYEKEAETLKAQLRMQEALSAVTGQDPSMLSAGLCIRCSENEAVLPATFANKQATIDRITKYVGHND